MSTRNGSRVPGARPHATTATTIRKSPTTMTTYRSTDMNLLHEALSRARMLRPLDEASHESGKSARRVAMRARAHQASELGDASQPAAR
jgi:hypothetical protein